MVVFVRFYNYVGSSIHLVIAEGIMLLNRRDRRRSFVAIARIIENREKETRRIGFAAVEHG